MQVDKNLWQKKWSNRAENAVAPRSSSPRQRPHPSPKIQDDPTDLRPEKQIHSKKLRYNSCFNPIEPPCRLESSLTNKPSEWETIDWGEGRRRDVGWPPEILALKHKSRILGHWSNAVSGSRKSHASSPKATQYRV